METEELKETNPVRKDILLQKYGVIAPKLTEFETFLIAAEEEALELHGHFAFYRTGGKA